MARRKRPRIAETRHAETRQRDEAEDDDEADAPVAAAQRWRASTVAQLRAELRDLGLATDGVKATLVARLQSHHEEREPEEAEEAEEGDEEDEEGQEGQEGEEGEEGEEVEEDEEGEEDKQGKEDEEGKEGEEGEDGEEGEEGKEGEEGEEEEDLGEHEFEHLTERQLVIKAIREVQAAAASTNSSKQAHLFRRVTNPGVCGVCSNAAGCRLACTVCHVRLCRDTSCWNAHMNEGKGKPMSAKFNFRIADNQGRRSAPEE